MKPHNAYAAMQTVMLDRVTVIHQTIVDAEIGGMLKSQNPTRRDMALRLLEEEDAYARRLVLRAFGKTETYEIKTPRTWWQHIKLALRTRWPRLFRRLEVDWLVQRIDTGAVVAGLPKDLGADRFAIPYTLGPQIPLVRREKDDE